MQLLIATTNGVAVCAKTGEEWRVQRRELLGRNVTSVAAQDRMALAGTKDGLVRSEDGGKTWQPGDRGITDRHVRWLEFHPEASGRAFAGTEPANLYLSQDGGVNWRECPEVPALRDSHGWALPYSPEAGCVRGFAFHGARGYAAVEVGGLLRSEDQGETWNLAEGSDGNPDLEGPPEPKIYPDVHSIEVHPSSADLLFAPTGGGFYLSRDGGGNWAQAYNCYCRAVWADPNDPRHLVLGPADGVDRNGRIEESFDMGLNWHPASAGLEVLWRRGMVERFCPLPGENGGGMLLAVLSTGQLLAARLPALKWERILPDVTGVQAVATSSQVANG